MYELQKEGEGLAQNMAEAMEEGVNVAFALDFTGEICFQESEASEISGKIQTKEGMLLFDIR